MATTFRAVTLLPLIAIALIVLVGCGSTRTESNEGEDSDRLRVVATTTWHSDLAGRIGGNRVDVEGLMEPGVDPHLYAATAGDVESLAEADVAVWNGLELEGKLDRVFEHVARNVPVITVGEAVPEADRIPITGTDEFDPHIWFDPGAWSDAAEAVAAGFSQADPGNAETYAANLADFRAEIEATVTEIEAMVESIPEPSRVLVTSHDAFSYLGRAFGFEVEPIQGISTASEATTADIERVARRVAEAELEAVFIESSVPRQTAEAVLAAAARQGQQARLGGELLGDALGAPESAEGNWAGALKHNARTIVEGLAGGSDDG